VQCNAVQCSAVQCSAVQCVEQHCRYDLAQKFCQRALEQDSDHPRWVQDGVHSGANTGGDGGKCTRDGPHTRALEMTGNLLLELGQVEKAQQCLGR
jgi:hypothetical protein